MSSSALPPPPPPINTDPARVAESNLGRILGVTTTIHVLAIVLVGLRMYARLWVSKNAARDDWTMVAALVCASGGWSVFAYQAFHGLGRHQDTLGVEDMREFGHAGFWQSVLSANMAMGLLKISIALHLLRLNPGRWFVVVLWSSIGFVAAYTFMGVMTFFLHCMPMAAHWDKRLGNDCYPLELFIKFAVVNTSCNIFTDVLFATIPIPVIWRLQMPRRTRFYMIGILSLGYLAVAMGICKTIVQITFSKDKDKTFNMWVTFWGFLQLNTGIIAACAPSLRPIVARVLKLGETPSYASRSHGRATLRTIGGSGGSSARRRRDHYELETVTTTVVDEESEDEKKRSANSNEADGHNGDMKDRKCATAAFYVSGEESMGSQEMMLENVQRQGEVKGIVRTTEVTLS